MKLRNTIAALALGAAMSASAGSAYAACELGRTVKLADGNWEGIQVLNSISAMILKSGYDCDTEMVAGEMVPLFTALGKGDIDVFLDVWIPNNKEVWDKTAAQGAVVLGVLYPDATEGWYVPRYVIEGDKARNIEAKAPGLKSVVDLAANAKIFEDPEEPGKGRFLNCPIGWGCEQRNNTKVTAYGMGDAFTNFKPGTGAALDAAFAGAYKKGEPILGYYWEPTWLLGMQDMVKLEEPACTDANKDACASPLTEASATGSAKFVADANQVEDFFRNFKTASAEVSKMLAFLKNHEGSTRDDAAKDFLKNNEASWSKWVTPEAAAKIKAAL